MPRGIPLIKTIRFQLLAIVLAFILIGSVLFGFNTYSHNRRHIEGELERISWTFHDIFYEEIQVFGESLSMAMEVLVRDDELVELFARRDREALRAATETLYEELLRPEYEIDQFQFHLPPATSFLRLHHPDRYGDDLSSFRQTVLATNREAKPSRGIEVGRAGIGLRIVYPVWHDGEHVGSVEFGVGLSEFLRTASGLTDAEYAIGIYQSVFEQARRFSGSDTDVRVGDLVYYEMTTPEIREALARPDKRRVVWEGRTFMNDSFPILDFSGRNVGKIVVFKDITPLLRQQRHELVGSISNIAVLTILLCVFLVLFLRRKILKPIQQSMLLAEAMSEGHYQMELAVTGDSEMDKMMLALSNGIRDLESMQKEAIRSAQLASIGELSASIAHEINNPISGVINYSQILLNAEDLTDRQKDLLQRIQKEGTRIARIVRNMLNYARDSKGEKGRHDIVPIISDSLALLEPDFRKDGIRVSLDLEPFLPLIRCNTQQVEQVLINILRNAGHALKDNRPDQRFVTIEGKVVVRGKEEYLQLTLANNGPHIPPGLQQKIQQPFITTKPAGQGTGLGLSIALAIMKEHGGQFEIRSEPGERTQMILRFPLHPDADTGPGPPLAKEG